MGSVNIDKGSGAKRLKSTHQASEAHKKNRRVKKTTERTLLQDMVAKLEAMDGAVGKLTEQCVRDAMAGNKDAREFIGKYLLGNAKVSLSDLHNPPIVRPSRK